MLRRSCALFLLGASADSRAEGPRNIIPSALVWGVTGTAGQLLKNYADSRPARQGKDEESSWFRSKWSPLKKLTDQEYVSMMEEKILKVETEIALIDDRITALRKKATESNSQEGAPKRQ